MPDPETPQLVLRQITKAYPGILANDAIDLTVGRGEIHALLGENGAGKSTLVKIIYGVTQPDSGTIEWQGQQVRLPSPAHARRLGIGMVFQHFTVFETLTVVENVALGLSKPGKMATLAARIREVSQHYGLKLDPDRHVHSLSVGERQRVEIVRCLLQEPKLLIMDEPTSVLTPQEATTLFATLRRLATEGVSILFISHKLEEVRQLCDNATILRQGRRVADCVPKTLAATEIARLMVGRDPPGLIRPAASTKTTAKTTAKTPALAVRDVSVPTADPFGIALKSVSFDLYAGELMGIAGVAGNGQSELLAALSGENVEPEAGVIRMADRDVTGLTAAARRRLGLAFVPEERLGRGAVSDMSLSENAILTAHGQGLVRRGILRRRRADHYTQDILDRFAVAAGGTKAEAQSLSGGNMQKFIIGREVAQTPRVLLAAHPTWGVDVGAAAAIDQALIDLARDGAGVLVVSEDIDELLTICDRIAVICDGRLSPVLDVATADRGQLGEWMAGGFVQKDADMTVPPVRGGPHAA